MQTTYIDPDGIYLDGDVRLALSVTGATLARARRTGRLRYSRQGHTILYRGQWLIDWLESSTTNTAERPEVSHA